MYMISAKKMVFREPTLYTIHRKRISSGISYTMAIILIKRNFICHADPINSKGELWATINAFDLCEDYKKGKLKGKLKEVAATLGEDDNRVIMLVNTESSLLVILSLIKYRYKNEKNQCYFSDHSFSSDRDGK